MANASGWDLFLAFAIIGIFCFSFYVGAFYWLFMRRRKRQIKDWPHD